jgi:hypothetical protein
MLGSETDIARLGIAGDKLRRGIELHIAEFTIDRITPLSGRIRKSDFIFADAMHDIRRVSHRKRKRCAEHHLP